jgi:phosphoribosylformylglycinamidine cyclo-ligase
MAHITGGGIIENLPRVLPGDCQARIRRDSWKVPSIFTMLKRMGNITEEEMYKVFNNGLGMILIIPRDQEEKAVSILQAEGEQCFRIGEITPREPAQAPIEWI